MMGLDRRLICQALGFLFVKATIVAAQTTAIYQVDVEGTKQARPIIVRDGWHLLSPSYLQDAERILFCGWPFEHSLAESLVFRSAPDGSDQQQITSGYAPAWNRAAGVIAAQEYDEGVLVFEQDGTGRELYASNRGNPQWSPDGSRLAVLNWAHNIELIDISTGKKWELLLPKDAWVPLPGFSFSPDGSKICLVGRRSRSFNSYGVLTVDVDPVSEFATPSEAEKRQLRLLYDGPANGGTTWSPDGKRIAFSLATNGSPPQIHLLDSESEDQTPRHLSGQPTDRWNVHPCWSPNGNQILFSSYLNMPPGSPQIQAMPTDLPQEPAGRLNFRQE